MAIIDINQEALDEAVKDFQQQGYEIYAKKANVANRDEVEAAMEEVVNKYGSLDILVNNAGIIRDNLLFKMTDDDWQQVMDVHVKGSFICARIKNIWWKENTAGL